MELVRDKRFKEVKRDMQLNLRVTLDDYNKLKALSTKMDKPMSEVIRVAVTALEGKKRKK